MHSRDFAYAEGLSTADDLPVVRARLIAAGDEQSRRIERALHDGVQQDLVAASVRLQLARRLAASDLPAAMALLGEIEDDVRGALDRVRSLADEIYPSVLEARGLVDALRGAAFRPKVEAHGIGRYRADVERAVFFLCRAVACSGASTAIRLREEGESYWSLSTARPPTSTPARSQWPAIGSMRWEASSGSRQPG